MQRQRLVGGFLLALALSLLAAPVAQGLPEKWTRQDMRQARGFGDCKPPLYLPVQGKRRQTKTQGLSPLELARVGIKIYDGNDVKNVTDAMLAITLPLGAVVNGFKEKGDKRCTRVFAKQGLESATPGLTFYDTLRSTFYWYDGYISPKGHRDFQWLFHYQEDDCPSTSAPPTITLAFQSSYLAERGMRTCPTYTATLTYPVLPPTAKSEKMKQRLAKKRKHGLPPNPVPSTCAPTALPTVAPSKAADTASPTARTAAPTTQPSALPTKQPSAMPSMPPSQVPSYSPSGAPTGIFDETIDALLPATNFNGLWSSAPTSVNAVSEIIPLTPEEVLAATGIPGPYPSNLFDYPGALAQQLPPGDNTAKTTANVYFSGGAFDGMLFKDFVLGGFDMTFLWYVLQVPLALATTYTPQVKIVVYSPSTGKSLHRKK